jgi:UDP-N-acetylmuramate--alanine ligase
MKKIYIVGIGGAGTSALALIYKKRGFDVVGSDEGDDFYVSNFEQEGIDVYHTFNALHITQDIDLVIYTTALSIEKNVELQKAKALSLKIQSYPEAVGELTQEYKTIAVCGTHGKTTTAALLAHAFVDIDKDPIALVGSKISNWNSGAYVGTGKYFILESDEYQNKLAFYKPYSIILTSLDYDHPDFFHTFEDYKKVFSDFVKKIPSNGFLVANGDDDDVRDVALSANCQVFFYGESKMNNCQIVNRNIDQKGQDIVVQFRDEEFEIKTQLFGIYNAKNVVAAWIMSFLVSNDAVNSASGVSKCVGTARRFERRGELNGAILIDDYAHHPEEIKATLQTVKEIFQDKNIIVAFHPHTFSRTEALFDEFTQAFSIADEVILLDIFASVRETTGNITTQDLVDKINCNKKQNIHTIKELANWMKNNLTEKDVFLTMGAGDIYKVYDLIKK